MAIISNYELAFLSLAVNVLFFTMKKQEPDIKVIVGVDTAVMIFCTAIVFSCATYTFPYLKFLKRYIEKYKEVKNS